MQPVDVTLTSMAHGGPALGRDADGRVVLVDGGLPPEAVRVRLTRERRRMAEGVLDALPDPPSPDRILHPPCPYFGQWPERGQEPAASCGGCQWQHIDYAAQLRFKRQIALDALRRIAGLVDPPVAEVQGMPEPWRYRNRLTMRATPGGLGLVAADGASTLEVADCLIASELVGELIGELGDQLAPGVDVLLRAGTKTGDQMIVLLDPQEQVEAIDVDSSASVVLSRPGGIEQAAGRPFLVERLAGRMFLVPPQAFFQVNTQMAEVLAAEVRAAIPRGTGLLVDAFCGVGTFALVSADLAKEVVAIDSDPAAVAAAVENAVGLCNVTLLEGTAEEGLRFVAQSPDVLVVDPPRSGLPRAVHRYLADRRPPTIIYVSCEPATLARDAGMLAGSGYRLQGCRPVDMFPHSFHVESVSVFLR